MFSRIATVALLAISSLNNVAAVPELAIRQAACNTQDIKYRMISSMDPSHTVCSSLQNGPTASTRTVVSTTTTVVVPTATTTLRPMAKRQANGIPPHMAALGTTAIASACSCFGFSNINFPTTTSTITSTFTRTSYASTVYITVTASPVQPSTTVGTAITASTSLTGSTTVAFTTTASSTTTGATCTITGFSKRSFLGGANEGVFAFENEYSHWVVM